MTDNSPLARRLEPLGLTSATARSSADDDGRLDALLNRIQQLTTAEPLTYRRGERRQPRRRVGKGRRQDTTVAREAAANNVCPEHEGWVPIEPETLAEAGLTDGEVEALILKALNSRSEATGRNLAEHIRLSFRLVDPLLAFDEARSAGRPQGRGDANDYVYQLTDLGRERAKKLAEHCTYFGAAPVPLADYIDSVTEQTLADQHPTRRRPAARVRRPADQQEHAAAAWARRSTRAAACSCTARRATARRASPSASPRPSASTSGFRGRSASTAKSCGCSTPACTKRRRCSANQGLLDQRKIDQRWVRIRRPTIVVGGELTMDQLEVTLNTATNVSEAPLQLKSNCGTLVIDDFGRQRMTTDELLNRWIVPLEKRYDFLQPGQRQEDPGAVRSVDHLLDEPGAEGPGRRRVPAAYSVQDRSARSERRRVPRAVQDHGAECWASSTTRTRSTT